MTTPNITIDKIIDYITLVLSPIPIEYELTNGEMALMIDMVRDSRHIMNISMAQSSGRYIGTARVNIVRSKELEMNIICALLRQNLGCRIEYQPERITEVLKLIKNKIKSRK